ncbi:hypothetical protein OV079_02495 [Nannocystis pusilla]|uniref:Uncharacterized protein n=1 Tax=Nannocystis pusilla TaxID=889268 RepID=A0A9X3EJR1_9BACT|nr:hypothetical protein [Nannocystis pusilla]MCY1004455.1 hypothetical protein [Nannocystis pusilla]
MRAAVADYYKGRDLSTAQTIRRAESDTEAARYIAAIRQGRIPEVLAVAASAVTGVVVGALAQKAVNNATVGGVPPVAALGLVPAVAGMAFPLSLSGRSVLTTGGLTYATGALLYKMLVPKAEASP